MSTVAEIQAHPEAPSPAKHFDHHFGDDILFNPSSRKGDLAGRNTLDVKFPCGRLGFLISKGGV